MNILIIGSKGFIGSHCMEAFSSTHKVWGADIETDYISENYFQVDTTNVDYKFIFEKQPFDCCINCSGAASVPRSFETPLGDFSLNVFNVVKIMDAIRAQQPTCKFINLSSAAVYGSPTQLPISEQTPYNPLSPYGYHKMMAELAVQEYAALYATKALTVRLFSVYGPRLQKQLFWDWHSKIQANSHLTVLGSGNESRDFIFVSDVAAALHLVAENGNFDGSAIQVSGGMQWFIHDVVALFQQHYFQPFTYSFSDLVRTGDPINWHADISKIRALGFEPKVTLEDGLKKYFKWLANERK